MKWTKIDLESCSKIELEEEIHRLKNLKNSFVNAEQGIKIFINSVYGACGSPWFAFFNMEVAEAVTLQGQDLIKYSEKILDNYFLKHWHKDTKLHELLGVTNVKPIHESTILYCDTDSNYVRFSQILDNCDYDGTPKQFILDIYNKFLLGYLDKCYSIYAKRAGTENFQSFELEAISESGVWLAKKKYVYNPIWKDPGIDVEPLSDITAKGVEIVQSSSAPFVRETLKNLMKYIFIKKQNFSPVEFASILKKYKGEYKLKKLDDIAKSSSIGNYEKHVLQDKESLVLEKGCPIHVRAAAIYNHTLFNSQFKGKYQAIRTGEKVKFYRVKTNSDQNVFAFISGSFPIEFAPPIDHDEQFLKDIVMPINRFVEAMGFPALSSQLVVATQLF